MFLQNFFAAKKEIYLSIKIIKKWLIKKIEMVAVESEILLHMLRRRLPILHVTNGSHTSITFEKSDFAMHV